MKIIPDLDDARAEPDDDPEDAALEAETAIVRVLLGAMCHGRHTRAVMAGLSLTLQAVVVEVSRDLPAIEAFVELFGNALRHRWAHEQQQAREQAAAQQKDEVH